MVLCGFSISRRMVIFQLSATGAAGKRPARAATCRGAPPQTMAATAARRPSRPRPNCPSSRRTSRACRVGRAARGSPTPRSSWLPGTGTCRRHRPHAHVRVRQQSAHARGNALRSIPTYGTRACAAARTARREGAFYVVKIGPGGSARLLNPSEAKRRAPAAGLNEGKEERCSLPRNHLRETASLLLTSSPLKRCIARVLTRSNGKIERPAAHRPR